MGRALQHYLDHALALHLPGFDGFFPSSFDWRRLCADLPQIARRAGHLLEGPAGEESLESDARSVFPAAHVMALALLAAAAEGDDDPEALLGRLADVPTEEGESVFDDLVADRLAAVEERLAGVDLEAQPPEDVEEAALLVAGVWAPLREALLADESGLLQEHGPEAEVLWSIVRVAAVLAAFRWMALAREDEDWPDVPFAD